MSSAPWALHGRSFLNVLRGNELARRTDRLEAFALVLTLAVALLALPFAVQLGERTHTDQMNTISEQLQQRHSIEAVAVGNSVTPPDQYSRHNSVRAQWQEGNETRTARVVSRTPVYNSAPVTVWLDRTGEVVAAPNTPIDALATAFCVACAVWLGAVVATALTALLVRYFANSARARAWERALQLMAHNDDGWANRSP